jgi:hypothetical protein
MKTVDPNPIIKLKNNYMEYLPVFGLIFIIVGIISWRWVVGIDYMKKNHPDYKGDDWLNWNNEDNGNDKDQIT